MSAIETGKRIRDYRTARRLSQEELGGGRYSGSYISHLESGRRIANAEVLNFIAAQLGVSPGDIDASITPTVAVDVVEAMLGVQEQLNSSEWAAAARQALRAAELAKARGKEDRVWEARYLQTQAMFNDGRYADAGDVAEELAASNVVRAAPGLRCMCLVMASRARRASGRNVEAMSRALDALAIADLVQVGQAILTQVLGAVVSASSLNDPQAAASAADRLRVVAADLHGQSLGVAMWQLGVYDLETGNPDRGLAQLEEALEHLNPQVDMRLWARLHRTLGHFLVVFGQLEEADQHLGIASSLLRYVGNHSDLIDLRLSQASLARARGEIEQAISLVQFSLKDEAISMDASLRGEAHLLMSELYCDKGEIAEARASAQKAALAYEEAGGLSKAVAMWRRYADLAED